MRGSVGTRDFHSASLNHNQSRAGPVTQAYTLPPSLPLVDRTTSPLASYSHARVWERSTSVPRGGGGYAQSEMYVRMALSRKAGSCSKEIQSTCFGRRTSSGSFLYWANPSAVNLKSGSTL